MICGYNRLFKNEGRAHHCTNNCHYYSQIYYNFHNKKPGEY